MFCKNCGNEMDNAACICVKCGLPKGSGENFCPTCGKPINADSEFCMNCGCSTESKQFSDKSKLTAGLLAVFLGAIGIHNFYLGHTQRGTIQLVATLLLSGTYVVPIAMAVWGIVEAVNIFMDKMTDSDGLPLKD